MANGQFQSDELVDAMAAKFDSDFQLVGGRKTSQFTMGLLSLFLKSVSDKRNVPNSSDRLIFVKRRAFF